VPRSCDHAVLRLRVGPFGRSGAWVGYQRGCGDELEPTPLRDVVHEKVEKEHEEDNDLLHE